MFPELAIGYLQVAPNGKLPLKKHEASILNEHVDHGQLWYSQDNMTEASKFGGILRTYLVKFRELKQYPAKMRVIKDQAVLSLSLSLSLSISLSLSL